MADSLKGAVDAVLGENGLSRKKTTPLKSAHEQWTVEVPSRLPIPSLHLQLQEKVQNAGGNILAASGDPETGKTDLRIGFRDSCLFLLILMKSKIEKIESGRIAVVIDDFGDKSNGMVHAFMDLDFPITFSVLPGRKYSTRIAQEAFQNGHEVILHLAMEPLDESYRDDGYIILKSMNRVQILEVIERSLQEVPSVLGVNNHMGSRVTQDRATMMSVLGILHQKGLFFMDSYTIASSIAFPMAQEMGLRTARRDVFLDAGGDQKDIQEKIRDLAARARKNGSAIGIGHCHQTMLEAIREEIPTLQERGYRFVFLSELVD